MRLIWVHDLNVILMTKWNLKHHLENIKRVGLLQLVEELFWPSIRTLDFRINRRVLGIGECGFSPRYGGRDTLINLIRLRLVPFRPSVGVVLGRGSGLKPGRAPSRLGQERLARSEGFEGEERKTAW